MTEKVKKIFFLAGEQSGDLHGALVIKQLKRIFPEVAVSGVGGSMMKEAGMECIYSCDDLAVIGFIEVIKNIRRLMKIEKGIAEWLKKERPEMVVLIDYPGFNKRIAKIAKKLGIHVLYYICPQVWAWHSSRVKEYTEIISESIVVFPFEVDIWRKAGGKVNYFGHPLIGVAKPEKTKSEFLSGLEITKTPVISLMPGSRKQEIGYILPELLKTAKLILNEFADAQFILPLASAIDDSLINEYLIDSSLPIKVVRGQTYDAVAASDLCIVASGTATLETAIIGTPMIVVYRVNWLTSFLSRYLIEAEHIGLPNVIAGKRIIPEFIRDKFEAQLIAKEAVDILKDKNRQKSMHESLNAVREKLGNPGAGERVAQYIAAKMRELK
ncbi:MAG: lipid-A-disaccharide synthase [Candidatus Riflebacteria bacterium]|nr:lipid-A-disaccharide synthase [Candidatus Riflebacteria bacterium]